MPMSPVFSNHCLTLKLSKNTDPVYKIPRKMILSANNPFFFKGKAAEGVGGPHAGWI